VGPRFADLVVPLERHGLAVRFDGDSSGGIQGGCQLAGKVSERLRDG
jgi:hypothetical protein